MSPPSGSWASKAWSALLVVVAVALGVRVAWELLKPLAGVLLLVAVLVGLVLWALRGRQP